jgi:hypothetical protein
MQIASIKSLPLKIPFHLIFISLATTLLAATSTLNIIHSILIKIYIYLKLQKEATKGTEGSIRIYDGNGNDVQNFCVCDQ